jgi:uncharacterized glyoxalase superfamily protein PhnB
MATRKKAAKVAKRAAGKKPAAKKAGARRAKKAQPIPKGYHILTPSLVVRGAAEAIEFYKKAFGAKEKGRMLGPDGKVMHAEIRIGDSIVMMGEEYPERGSKSPQTLGGSSSSVLIYTKDADKLFAQATAAGATARMPVTDMFWGDRWGMLEDPYGHVWQIATHKEDLTPKEMMKRMAAQMGGQGGQGASEPG